ncbi:DUF2293 domain-containing protein [Roseibium sp.]|uniref:DUF2293 domain-containing protein n=1 Tax=Roseibium sp. TaxID=1936156 RepID=UPI003A9723BC
MRLRAVCGFGTWKACIAARPHKLVGYIAGWRDDAGDRMTGQTKRQKDMRKALRATFPRIAFADSEQVLQMGLAGHLRHLPISIALWQAATSHIRHAHTDYDLLLDEGYDREAARFFVMEDMNRVLEDWGCARRIEAGTSDDVD